jgi:hypothetical protein
MSAPMSRVQVRVEIAAVTDESLVRISLAAALSPG